ncbi:uncharacterized protein PG998_009006 [Apiospora kogelbergensis]|uniref:uncharacterized protein n=1 Tax=Apiospora kogelbergensis TaxID=1337665 RepID=UPI0031322124
MESPGEPVENVALVAEGDLVIQISDTSHINHQIKEFVVDSFTISRASDKWKELLITADKVDGFGHNLIALEGDATYHAIFLSIMFWRFDNVPKVLGLSELVHLPQVAVDYQLLYRRRLRWDWYGNEGPKK